MCGGSFLRKRPFLERLMERLTPFGTTPSEVAGSCCSEEPNHLAHRAERVRAISPTSGGYQQVRAVDASKAGPPASLTAGNTTLFNQAGPHRGRLDASQGGNPDLASGATRGSASAHCSASPHERGKRSGLAGSSGLRLVGLVAQTF